MVETVTRIFYSTNFSKKNTIIKRRNFVKTSLLASPTLVAATSVNSTSHAISKY
jgi:hypothetical protein